MAEEVHDVPNTCDVYSSLEQLIPEKEPSMLTKLPQKFTFDQSTAAQPPTHLSTDPVTDNPTYFEQGFAESSFGATGECFSTRSRAPVPPPPPYRGRLFSLPPIPVSHPELSHDDVIEEPELDVFLSPSETEFDGTPPSLPKSEKRGSTFGRLTQFLWRSKGSSSKSSVGGSSIASTGSRSRSASSGISSPPFTPDSSISNYTNSLDSDSHSSSHSQPSNSDQGHYPEIHFYRPVRTHQENYDLDIDTLSPLSTSYSNERPFGRGRTHSLSSPLPNTLPPKSRQICKQPSSSYYNTQNLETFHCPNITRRHSVASEPTSPTVDVDPNSYANWTVADEQMAAGYLVPIQTRPNCSSSLQHPPRDNVYINELPFPKDNGGEDALNTVQVEVHTPTSSNTYSDMFCNSSASTAIPQSVYSYRRPSLGGGQVQGQKPLCSSDSSSTIEATSMSNGDFRQMYKALPQSQIRREYCGRETDCEIYCKFCSSTSLPVASPSRSSKMNVGILSCHGCFFSKSAVGQIRKIFDTIVTPDRAKINVNLQEFDIQDIGENVKGVELHRAKIQIVVISHSFLDHLRHESTVQKRVSMINQILRSKRAIIVLLSGVGNGGSSTSNQNEGSDGFLQHYLLQFSNWETLELKPSSKLDGEFYTKFAEKVLRIYNLEQRPPARFSIFPKKVTKLQERAVIFFKNAIEKGDSVSIQIGRGRKKEFLQEVVLVNPYSGIIKLPSTLFATDRSVLIEITLSVNEQVLGSKFLKYDHNAHLWEDDVVAEIGDEVQIDDSAAEPVASPSSSTTAPPIEYYDMPRPTKQDYCIPPAARPVVPQKPQSSRNKQIVVANYSSPEDTQSAEPLSQYANLAEGSNN